MIKIFRYIISYEVNDMLNMTGHSRMEVYMRKNPVFFDFSDTSVDYGNSYMLRFFVSLLSLARIKTWNGNLHFLFASIISAVPLSFLSL